MHISFHFMWCIFCRVLTDDWPAVHCDEPYMTAANHQLRDHLGQPGR